MSTNIVMYRLTSALHSFSSRLHLRQWPQLALLHQRGEWDPGSGWWNVFGGSAGEQWGSFSASRGVDCPPQAGLCGLRARPLCGWAQQRPAAFGGASERSGCQQLLYPRNPSEVQLGALRSRRPMPRGLEQTRLRLHWNWIYGPQLWDGWGK